MPTGPRRLPLLSRRALLELFAAGVGTQVVGCDDPAPTTPRADSGFDAGLDGGFDAGFDAGVPPSCDGSTTGFFSDCDRQVVSLLADHILPDDDEPGATALGAVDYIENLLTALDGPNPRIYAGGPYSGRAPRGMKGVGNDFATFLPLDRVAAAAWRLRLFGSEGGGPNDAIIGRTEGLRPMFRRVLGALPPGSVTADTVTDVFNHLPEDFRSAFAALVMEGAFGAPEYGGNRNLAGWRTVHFGGDVQPRGYSTWDPIMNRYTERSDAPVSTVDPGDDPAPLTADTLSSLRIIALALGGRVHT